MATITHAGSVSVKTTGSDRAESRARLIGAAFVMLASFLFILGLMWDIQWHADVGPDSFWTPSHSLLYSGSAVAGLASLFVVLSTTLKFRRGDSAVTEATTTPWLGIFRAPLGFIISGMGGLCFLLNGGYDLWWHTNFGFDITLFSPPHFGLIFSGVIMCFGLVYIFASEANRAAARGEESLLHPAKLGLMVSMAFMILVSAVFLEIPLEMFRTAGPFITYALIGSVPFSLALWTVASFFRRPGVATLTALIHLALRQFFFYGVPVMVRAEAAWAQLPFREDRNPANLLPVIPMVNPVWLVVAGLLIDVGLFLAARYNLWSRTFVWVTSAVAMVAFTAVDRRWEDWWSFIGQAMIGTERVAAMRLAELSALLYPTLGAVAVIAALAGWLGWNVGVALRYSDR